MAKTNNGKPSIYFSKTRFKSAAGIAKFPALVEPDSYKGGDPTFKVTVMFDQNDPEFVAMKAEITAFAAEFSKECGRTIDPSSVIRADKLTGDPCISFKSKARRDDAGNYIVVPVVNSDKQPCDTANTNDRIRVAFSLGGWESAFGAGIKPYLVAVQVVERNAYKAGSGFNATDVFDEGPGIKADDIPF
jgi:hypothetical protein